MHGRNPADCTHHWVLGEPQPRSIQGVCRRCGARKQYPSVLELPERFSDTQQPDSEIPVLAAAAKAREEEALA